MRRSRDLGRGRRGGVRLRQLEPRRERRRRADTLRILHPGPQHHPVLPEARPARRRRSAAVRRHRRVRRRTGRQRHRRPRASRSRTARSRSSARATSFVARYRVSLSFKREGAPSVDLAREEVVRVPTFQETLRSDESILFQQVLRLVPGAYNVSVDRARRRLDLREPRPGRIHGAELRRRAASARRSWRTRPRGGGTWPIRSTWCSTRAAPWATAATRCSPTSRATASTKPSHRAVQGGGRAGARHPRGRAPLPRRPRGREPGHPALARQRVARRAPAGRRGRARPSARCRRWSPSPRPGWSPTSTRCSTCCATSATTTRSAPCGRRRSRERARLWREFYAATDPNTVDARERGAQPVLRPDRPGQPALQR